MVDYCRREVYWLHADIVMTLNDILAYPFPETDGFGRILAERRGGSGKGNTIKFSAKSLQGPWKWGKILTFFLWGIPHIVLVTSALRISMKLSRNTCESMTAWIVPFRNFDFSVKGSLFSKTALFGRFWVLSMLGSDSAVFGHSDSFSEDIIFGPTQRCAFLWSALFTEVPFSS